MSEMDKLKKMAQEHHDMKKEIRKLRAENKRLNAVLDDLVGECRTKSVSSRVCGRGTKCCVVYHGEYKRNRGDDNG